MTEGRSPVVAPTSAPVTTYLESTRSAVRRCLFRWGAVRESTLSASLPATRVQGGHESPSKDAIGHLGGKPFDTIQSPSLLVGR
jgi:hypothetical protein